MAAEEVTADADCGDEQCEWRSHVHPQANTSIPGESSPFLKLGLTSLEKDATSNSWLTLDSRPPVDLPSTKAGMKSVQSAFVLFPKTWLHVVPVDPARRLHQA